MHTLKDRITKRLQACIENQRLLVAIGALDSALQRHQKCLMDHCIQVGARGGNMEDAKALFQHERIGNSDITPYATEREIRRARDAIEELVNESFDILIQEHRADVWDKVRTTIFRIASAIGIAAVVLGAMYVAHYVLEIPLPLARIPI